jgi:hypothetical protein
LRLLALLLILTVASIPLRANSKSVERWPCPFYSTPSYTQESTIIRAEFNLYRTKDEKLLWSGESDTVYSKDFDKLSKDYAKMLVKQLKRDKVIDKR